MPKKWVLIVDDDPANLLLLESVIEHPGIDVTTATDALQAFIQARDLKPGLTPMTRDAVTPCCGGIASNKAARLASSCLM